MDSASKPPTKTSGTTPPVANKWAKAPVNPSLLDKLFPPGSTRRKLAIPVIAAVIVVAVLVKVGVTTVTEKIETTRRVEAEAIRVQTTGILVVKTNLASAEIEALRATGPDESPATSIKAPAGQSMGNLPPGKYTLTLRAAGWPDTHGEIDVPAGQTTETTVNFPTGSLHVDSSPAGATVKWRGHPLGKTPLLVPQLPPGEVDLSLQFSNWPAVPLTATVTADTESSTAIRLPHGRLTVDSVPAGAIVVLDGKAYKQTPLFFDPIPAGPKKLVIQAEDFPPLEVSADVIDGEETKIRPHLGTSFPILDPVAVLRDVWVVDGKRNGAPAFNSITQQNRPRNDVVRNIHRQVFYNNWQNKIYRLTGTINSIDGTTRTIEFQNQRADLAPYRVHARLATDATIPTLPKGATITVYGRLTELLESPWPLRIVTFELTDSAILPESEP